MPMTGKQVVVFYTKKDKNEKQGKKTTMTVVWDGLSDEGVKAGFLSYLVVKVQGSFRNKGIPEQVTVNAKDHTPGTRHQMTPEEAFASLTPEQRAELVKKYSIK